MVSSFYQGDYERRRSYQRYSTDVKNAVAASRHPDPGKRLAMDEYMSFRKTEPVYHIRRQTYSQLRKLSGKKLEEVSAFMNQGEREHTLQIRDGIIEYFDRLIRERGVENVIIDE